MSQADEYQLMDELSRRWQEYGSAYRETIRNGQPERPEVSEHRADQPQTDWTEPAIDFAPAGLAAGFG
jgi:hypothetical protein